MCYFILFTSLKHNWQFLQDPKLSFQAHSDCCHYVYDCVGVISSPSMVPLCTNQFGHFFYHITIFIETKVSGRRYQGGAVRKKISWSSCPGKDIRKELSGKHICVELSGKRYQEGAVRKLISGRSCQDIYISEELLEKRFQLGAVRKKISEQLSVNWYQWGALWKKISVRSCQKKRKSEAP